MPPSTRTLDDLVAAAPGRLLVTCRQGGSGAPAGDERVALLARALRVGASAVDLEHRPGRAIPDGIPAASLVLSHHAPAGAGTPDVAWLASTAAAMAALRPAAVKVATPVASAADCLAWPALGESLPPDIAWAPVAMGSAGTWLRLLAGRHQRPGDLTYVAAEAPLPGTDLGQPLLRDALDVFATHRVDPSWRAYGVAGWPLRATWSPLLHSALFRRRGLDAVLVPLPVRDAAEARQAMDALRLSGLAITMPHKEAARGLASAASSRVASSGVANTLRLRHGAWDADSFDGPAGADALSDAMALAGARVVVLGAGGAASALVAELVARGARVTVLARDVARARALGERQGAAFGGIEDLESLAADAVVNATPAGGIAEPSGAVPLAAVRSPCVLDMVTTPALTPLVEATRARGATAVDGLSMLARQAAAQQAFWTEEGDPPPLGAPETETLLRELVERAGG